jgi:hypothetical protein
MKISPGNAQILSHLCLSHLHHHLPCKFGALEILASSPDDNAYYALPVRQASALPAASFRCNLAVVIFAVRLMVPLTGPIGRLALLSICAMPGAPTKKPRLRRAFLILKNLNKLKRSHSENSKPLGYRILMGVIGSNRVIRTKRKIDGAITQGFKTIRLGSSFCVCPDFQF